MPTAINLEKQIKRHVIARRHEFFAITHPGFEALCGNEIRQLGQEVEILETGKGGVTFAGRLTDLYRANLHLRTAGRVLMRLSRFKAANFNQLAHHTTAVAWEHFLPWGVLPGIRVKSRHSRLMHSQAVAEHIHAAIGQRWDQLGVLGASVVVDPLQSLWVRIEDDRVTLSLDSSCVNLYQRGLKTHPGRAPLRETFAAAILMSAGFRPDLPLLDPMCGAGTFSLEAAMITRQVPPGYFREFAFQAWPAFRERQWQHLKTAAQQAIAAPDRPMIIASDIDGRACRALSQCLSQNHLQDTVEVMQRDFFGFDPGPLSVPGPPGLVVLNPPYGRRLELSDDILDYYHRIGTHLAHVYKGWQAAVLAPASVGGGRLFPGLSSKPVMHGGLQLNLWIGTIC